MTTTAMPDLDLAHAKPTGMGQYRDETMELAIQAHLAKHFATVKLEATVVVVQAATGEAADKPVEYPAWIHLVPGIVTGSLPAAHNIVAFIEPVEKPGDFRRIILKVAVQGENQGPSRRLKRGCEGSCFAEVATEPDCADARVTLRKRKDDAPGTVAAAIVDENKFDRAGRDSGEDGTQLAVKLGQAFCLVTHGDDNADHGLG